MVTEPKKSYNYTPLPSPPTLPQSVKDYREEFGRYPRMLVVNEEHKHEITWSEYSIPVLNLPPAIAPLSNADVQSSPRQYWRIFVIFDRDIAPDDIVCRGFAESEE